jgi:thioredoxin 1
MKDVTKATLETNLGEGLTIVDLWAPWCGNCKTLMPILEEIEGAEQDVTFLKSNLDEDPGIAMDNGVMGIPTVLFYKNGEMVKKVSGVQTKEKWNELIGEMK